MSETVANQAEEKAPNQRIAGNPGNMPEELPPADQMDLDAINPAYAKLFSENRFQEFFERLRKEDPVHFNEAESTGRMWSLTRYEDIKRVDQDWKNFSSAHGITLGGPVNREGGADNAFSNFAMFIAMDPPKHDVQRKTVTGVVAPTNLAKLEPLIRERTRKVLDSLPEGEAFDWVDNVSIELTTMMLATLFDFPFEERRKLTFWSDAATTIPQKGALVETGEEKRDAILGCLEYFTRLWEERKEKPGDDLVSMLAHGEDTKHMHPMEFLGNLMLLIVGGNDTTRNTMSGSVYALFKQFPEQLAKLKANPELIPNMVAEIIRWQTPLAYMRRTANNDCEIGGKQIKAGDQILMWYVSGNRDEDVFENANEVNIERENVRHHLSFGFGIHRCMGNRLAELQLRILWEELLPRIENIEILEEPQRTYSAFVKGYTYMPVKITRRK